MTPKHYGGLDGLRAIACLGIVMMHMKANNSYEITGFIYNSIIPSLTDFTFLFMVISAFGMCCGYHDKMLSGQVNLEQFYKKRYLKALPFFACLVLIDLIFEFSKESLFEAIANVSLLFGLFPNDISVIGVGWFLGLIFAFYLLFPSFCVLIADKKRAWVAFSAALILNYICDVYFGLGRKNIIYSLCFFISGGLLFLYKDKLEQTKWFVILPILAVSIAAYYIYANTITRIVVSVALIVFAISTGKNLLQNKITSFISGISMEIYLSHMVIFRGIEKMSLNVIFSNNILQYLFTVSIVFAGAIVFSCILKNLLALINRKVIRL